MFWREALFVFPLMRLYTAISYTQHRNKKLEYNSTSIFVARMV